MLRVENSSVHRSSDNRSRSPYSLYAPTSAGTLRFRSQSAVVPVATPANDICCLVTRVEAEGSGLIATADSRKGLSVLAGGKNGTLSVRSALTAELDSISKLDDSFVSQVGAGTIAQRKGATVTAMCLTQQNYLWVGYNNGAIRVYELCRKSTLIGDAAPLVKTGRTLKDSASVSSGISAYQPTVGSSAPSQKTEDELLFEAKKHGGSVTAIVGAEHSVFSCSLDWKILRWMKYAPFELQGVVGTHSLGVRCLYATPRLLLSGGDDSVVKCWPFSPLDKKGTLEGHSSSVVCLACWRGTLWSGSEDGTIRLWDIEGTRACTKTLSSHRCHVVSITPLDNVMYSADKDGNILVWDLDSYEVLHCYRTSIPKPVRNITDAATRNQSPSARRAASPSKKIVPVSHGKAVTIGPKGPAAKTTNAPFIKDIRLVANIKGILAWVLTTEGGRLSFLPHRPIEEELERKVGSATNDLLEKDEEPVSREELEEMMRQIEQFEGREARQFEQLQDLQTQIEEYAGFTSCVCDETIGFVSESFSQFIHRSENLFAASVKAVDAQQEKEASTLRKKCAELEALVAEKEEKYLEKCRVLAQQQGKVAAAMASKAEEVGRLTTELQKTQADLKQATVEVRHLKDSLAMSDATIKRQGAKIEKSATQSSEMIALRQELVRTKEQLDSAKKEANYHIEKAKSLVSQSAELTSQSFEEAMAALVAEKTTLQQQLEEVSASAHKYKMQVMALETKNSQRLTREEQAAAAAERVKQTKLMLEDTIGSLSPSRGEIELSEEAEGNIYERIMAWRKRKGMDPNPTTAFPEDEEIRKMQLSFWPSLVRMCMDQIKLLRKKRSRTEEQETTPSVSEVDDEDKEDDPYNVIQELRKEVAEKTLQLEEQRTTTEGEREKLESLRLVVSTLKTKLAKKGALLETSHKEAQTDEVFFANENLTQTVKEKEIVIATLISQLEAKAAKTDVHALPQQQQEAEECGAGSILEPLTSAVDEECAKVANAEEEIAPLPREDPQVVVEEEGEHLSMLEKLLLQDDESAAVEHFSRSDSGAQKDQVMARIGPQLSHIAEETGAIEKIQTSRRSSQKRDHVEAQVAQLAAIAVNSSTASEVDKTIQPHSSTPLTSSLPLGRDNLVLQHPDGLRHSTSHSYQSTPPPPTPPLLVNTSVSAPSSSLNEIGNSHFNKTSLSVRETDQLAPALRGVTELDLLHMTSSDPRFLHLVEQLTDTRGDFPPQEEDEHPETEVDALLQYMNRVRRQLQQLELAVARTDNPALRQGIFQEMGRLHKILLGQNTDSVAERIAELEASPPRKKRIEPKEVAKTTSTVADDSSPSPRRTPKTAPPRAAKGPGVNPGYSKLAKWATAQRVKHSTRSQDISRDGEGLIKVVEAQMAREFEMSSRSPSQ